jgi:triacylglycerol lipase
MWIREPLSHWRRSGHAAGRHSWPSETTTILSFAGTDPLNFANWVSDFNWLPRSGDLHTGFRIAADVVWEDVIAVKAATDASNTLIITGHSLGAAIATLIANRLQREKSRAATAVYLFGAPRAGGRGLAAEYCDLLASRTFRLVHGGDIVPTVPPRFWASIMLAVILPVLASTNSAPHLAPARARMNLTWWRPRWAMFARR